MLFLKILKFISLLFSPQNLTLIILLNIEQVIKMMFSKTQTILQIPLTMKQKLLLKKQKKLIIFQVPYHKYKKSTKFLLRVFLPEFNEEDMPLI